MYIGKLNIVCHSVIHIELTIRENDDISAVYSKKREHHRKGKEMIDYIHRGFVFAENIFWIGIVVLFSPLWLPFYLLGRLAKHLEERNEN